MKINTIVNRILDREDTNVKAFASVTFDGVYAVHGIKVCEGEKGLFVAMPSTAYTGKNGEKQYNDTFHPITKNAREALNQSVLNAYEIRLQQEQKTEIEVKPESEEQAEEMADEPEPEMSM